MLYISPGARVFPWMLCLCHGWEVLLLECSVSTPWRHGGTLLRAFYRSSVKGGACPYIFDFSPSQRDSSLGATPLIPEGGFAAPQKFSAIHCWVSPTSSGHRPFFFFFLVGGYLPVKFPLSSGEDFSLGTLFSAKVWHFFLRIYVSTGEGSFLGDAISAIQ